MHTVSEPTGTVEVALAHAARLLNTAPQLAARQAAEVLKALPDHPAARLLLGTAHRLMGDLPSAIPILRRLAGSQPRWPEAHFELGLACADMGQFEQALQAMRCAVALRPAMPDAWRSIGDLLTFAGDAPGADAAYAQHIKAATRDPSLMGAAAALVDGRIAVAERSLRGHLKQHPTDVAALRMLAEVAARLARNADAQVLLERCIELAPSFHAARFQYAIVLQRQNKLVDALRELDTLEKMAPRTSSYRNLRAVILTKIGEYQQSLELYAEVLAANPREAKIWMSYGHTLATAGREQDCVAAYRESIKLAPNLGEAYWSLANLKTFRFDESDVTAIRRQLSREDLSAEDRLQFDFALGKALEDAGDYAGSFACYAEGNAIKRARIDYDPAELTAFVRRSTRLFDADFFRERHGFGAPSPDPIFVVGLPRSGSTLIEQILSSHSLVEGTMELQDIMEMAAELAGSKGSSADPRYPAVLAGMTAAEARSLGEKYLLRTRVQRKTGKQLFIDKMPNNFLHIGMICLALPNAKIIDARRHPMACCFSGFKQNFAQGHRFSYSLEEIGKYYRDYVELLGHFDRVLPGRVHRVIYERMVGDTEAEVRRLLDYCGLPFEPGCLRFYENKRSVRTASSQQVRQPIFTSGIDQWRSFEPWLDPLKDTLGPLLSAYPAGITSGA